jgi:surface-anchored protein
MQFRGAMQTTNPLHHSAAAAVFSLGILASSASAALYTAGHGDIGVGYEGGELHPHWHFHSNAVIDGVVLGGDAEFEPGEITAAVTSTATAPNDPTFNSGTGVLPGGTIWFLPQGNTPGVPFLGIATEELTPADWNGNITFALTGVTSPSGSGHFSLWQGGVSDTFFMSTNDPANTVNGNNTLQLAPGTHDHYNYGFSEEGIWTIELTVSGDHVTDGFQTKTESFAFQVPEPSTALLGLLGGLGLLRRRRQG